MSDDDDWDPDQGYDSSTSTSNDKSSNNNNNNNNNNSNIVTAKNEESDVNWDHWQNIDSPSSGNNDVVKTEQNKEEHHHQSAGSANNANAPSGTNGMTSFENYFTYEGNADQDEHEQTNTDDDDDDNDIIDPLRSFYNEALLTKMPLPQLPHSSQQQHQPHHASSTAAPLLSQNSNLSLAELSRLEQTLLSQTSHRDEEDERQRLKMQRREQRQNGITKQKKPRRPLTQQQLQRKLAYHRIKYSKSVDLSKERDVGGAMEYLIRKRFESPEEQRRLKRVAMEREEERVVKEREEEEARWRKDDEEFYGVDDNIMGDGDGGGLHSGARRRMDAIMTNNVKSSETNNTKNEPVDISNSKKALSSSSGKKQQQPNWNFREEGYVTMRGEVAGQLPYYLYKDSKRKIKDGKRTPMYNTADDDDVDDDIDGGGNEFGGAGEVEDESLMSGKSKERRKFGGSIQIFLEEDESTTVSSDCDATSAQSSSKCKNELEQLQRKQKKRKTNKKQRSSNSDNKSRNNNKKWAVSINEPDHLTHSFPLQFYQSKPTMDLHAHIDMRAVGPDRMIFTHGRNAKQLLARLVAGGADGNYHDSYKDEDEGGVNANNSVSNVSSASSKSSTKSSSHSYKPPDLYGEFDFTSKYNSLSPFESTSAMDAMNNATNKNNEVKNKTQNHVFRLLSLVHSLPKVSHRNRFLFKIAQELGTLRQFWENELRCWVEKPNATSIHEENGSLCSHFTPKQIWALKSFLGVDGNISPGPCWASDPSALTHPQSLITRMEYFRRLLFPRLRRLIRMKMKHARTNTLGTGIVDGPVGNNGVVGAKEDEDNYEQTYTERDLVIGLGTYHHDQVQAETDVKEEQESATIKEEAHQHTDDNSERPTSSSSIDRHNTKNSTTTNSAKNEFILEIEKLEDNADETAEDPKKFVSLLETIEHDTIPGDVDKYAKVIHDSHIDVSNITIAISAFLDRLSASKAQLAKHQQTQHPLPNHRHMTRLAKENVYQWHESIISYLKLAEEQTRPHDTNLFKLDGKYPQSAPLAQAIMARQSYIANGGGIGCGRKEQTVTSTWGVKEENHDDVGEDDCDSDFSDEENNEPIPQIPLDVLKRKELRCIQLAAQNIASKGKEHAIDNYLELFAPIHLSTGVAMIAELVTPHAAEIVSRPCCPDNLYDRTPFDLISSMLVVLDESKILISTPLDQKSRWNMRDKIIDDVLVGGMEEAAANFRKCVQKDPHNVEHWSWYIATLLGILCISSGVSLSNNSEKPSNVKAEYEESVTPKSRHRLENYHEILKETARSLIDFLQFARDEDCAMFHMAISSMLEWKIAMALLHSQSSDELISETRMLHAYHTHHWAIKDCTGISIARVQHLYETKQIPLDTMLDVLACAVERNPSDRNRWIRLVNMLRSKGKLECNDECNLHTNNTPKSCAYHMDIHGDRWWWGKGRTLEWEDQFFYAPKTSWTRVKPEFVRMVLGIIELPWLSNSQCLKSEFTTDASSVDKAAIIDDPKQCMNWLFRLTKNHDIETDEDESLKSTSAHDELLPTHISDVVCSRQDPITIDSSLKEIEDRLSINPSCEALCFKIAVACHLVGVSHPFVVNTIWWLAVKLWQSHQPNRQQQQTRDGVSDGLHWLSLHGLNILEILHKKLTLCQEDCS